MKVALIFPRFKYPSGDMPLGISYVAASIKKNCPETEVDLIDPTFEKDPLAVIEQAFNKNNYDLIGVSIMTTMLNDALEVAALARKYFPKAKILFGGPHTTVMPEDTLNNRNVDAVVIGEGEETIVDVLRNHCDFSGISGLWYKQDGEIIKNALRPPIVDLDTLDFPVRDQLPVEEYIKNNAMMDHINPKSRCIGLLATRGCPYRCSYCQPTLDKIFGKKLRKRSVKNIVDELAFLKEKYGIDSFLFEDDTFIIDAKWVHEFCDRLIESGLTLSWFCNVRANLVDRDLLVKMKSAGLKKVGIGIESGSQRILDEIYQKDITIEQVKNSVRILNDIGIKILGYVMVGAPTETREEIMQTIRLARTLAIDEAAFSITTPLPCTTLYEKSKELIKDDIGSFDYYNKCVYESTGDLSSGKIEKLKRRAYIEFYFAPKRIINTLKSFLAVKKMIYRIRRF